MREFHFFMDIFTYFNDAWWCLQNKSKIASRSRKLAGCSSKCQNHYMFKHLEQISIVSIKLVKYIPKRNSLYIKTKVGIQLFFDGINKVVYT